jgi:hypothetical protein
VSEPPAGASEASDADAPAPPDPPSAASDSEAAAEAGAGRRGMLVAEGMLALEIAALAAFAFSRPVLDSFGRSPETFVARGADARTIVLFGLVVALVPALALALVGLASRALGSRARSAVHLGLVAVLGGLAFWRLGRDITGWPGDATKLILAGLVGGPALAAVRWRLPSSRTFLRIAGVGTVVFLLQFLVASPAATLVTGDQPNVDGRTAEHVAGALGPDAPPIVFLVLDAFATNLLLDGQGQIDAELYPNIAELAGSGTWFRNNTTVSAFTVESVPAMLSGRYPEPSESARFAPATPDNLFTLFAGTHDLSVREPATRVCPESLCPDTTSGGLSALLGDAVDLWAGHVSEGDSGGWDLPGLLEADRYDDMRAWIDAQDFGGAGRPGLHFYHALLPHDPFDFLPDGTLYEGDPVPMTGMFANGWTQAGTAVARQRMVLQTQATDRLLGRLFDRMREAGVYDEAMIVVAGDHGIAFEPGAQWRGVSEEQFDEMMWSLLITKAPGQRGGEVEDRNVQTVDVLPIIAESLGFELPWEADGLSLSENDERDQSVKYLDDVGINALRAPDGEAYVEVDAQAGFERLLATDPVEGSGPDAVWQRTAYGELLGRSVGDLDAGRAADAHIAVDHLDRFDGIDTDGPLPLEVIGHSADVGVGDVVAYAVDGRIAALTEAEHYGEGDALVHALLWPESLHDGDNELTAYLVEGEVGDPVLRPVTVEGA